MTEPETRELLAFMASAFPNANVTGDTIAVYVTMLGDLEADAARRAVIGLIAKSKFFPTVAEIREAAVTNRLRLGSAEDAWGEVIRQIKAVGIYGDPEWSNPAVERAVRAIGWRELCMTELDDLNTTRAHFFRIYASYRERIERDANLNSLEEGGAMRLPSTPKSPWDDGAGFKSIGDVLPLPQRNGKPA